jgi:Holliday junction resolvase
MASKHQTRVIKQYEAEGWLVVNLIKTSKNGIPDLLCLRNGVAKFIECKEKNDTVKPLQQYRIDQLIAMGFEAIVDRADK